MTIDPYRSRVDDPPSSSVGMFEHEEQDKLSAVSQNTVRLTADSTAGVSYLPFSYLKERFTRARY